jgi:hypothetical protein
MKELPCRHKDKKGFWRKATTIAGGIVLLTACEQQSQITEGTIYQKEHIKEDWALVGRTPASRQEIDKEVISMPPAHEEREGSFGKETISAFFNYRNEFWKVYIAQCPKGELPSPERIKEECKTRSFDVPQEVYTSSQLGQQADFKKSK